MGFVASREHLECGQLRLPAAVTPSAARKRQGTRQKVRKRLVFLDRPAI
jgi:hypothetical protein